MANIKLSELSSVNQLDAQELNQVVGGWGKKYYGKKYYYDYSKYFGGSFFSGNNQQNFNTTTIAQVGGYKQVANVNTWQSNNISGSVG